MININNLVVLSTHKDYKDRLNRLHECVRKQAKSGKQEDLKLLAFFVEQQINHIKKALYLS